MAALEELARNYCASVVLCTATQPALRRKDGFRNGFVLDETRELAPDPPRLYAALRRVAVEVLPEPVADAAIAARFAAQRQMLCIVNSRAHARALFDAIAGLEGAAHLSTLMCPRHRRMVLAELRRRLAEGAPVRLVATSLIEAGVDIDFPEVWRAAAGLDSIAQAAGRCNREGRPKPGRVVVFMPAEAPTPPTMRPSWDATRMALRTHGADPLGPEAIRAYFGELYWNRGEAAFDAARLDGRTFPIMPAIAERARSAEFPFKSIARAFRLIEEVMVPVVVPWRGDEADRAAETLLARIAAMDRPLAGDLRRLQQYTVPIPRAVYDVWLGRGALRPVHSALGDELLRFDDLAHYRPLTGLDIGDTGQRAAESNIL
jgi:CRISPR-associated endonuclease/helicase Cas3